MKSSVPDDGSQQKRKSPRALLIPRVWEGLQKLPLFRSRAQASQAELEAEFLRDVQRELRPYLAQIQASIPRLDSATRETETRFLEISGRIESTTTTARQLVAHGEALISLAKGQSGGEVIIETAAVHISQAIAFVERNVEESEKLIQRLATAHEQISQSLASEQPLARALTPLTYVQTLFRVEASRLAPEVQMMFHSLVVDIEQVRQNVEGGFREKFQLIRDTQAILSRAIDNLRESTAEANLAAKKLRTHLTKSLEQMKQNYERNRDQQMRLTSVSWAVSGETDKVVMSLQFYDTFTQKLQHARKIVTEMESRISGLPDDCIGVCRTLHFLDQAGRICSAQLGAMNDELSRAGVAVSDGLQGVIGQLKALDGDCIALRDLDSVTTGVDGAVQILLDSLADTQQLVCDSERFAMESYQTIEPLGSMTTNFTRFMHNLSFEIHLIGLNAEVQSALVGQGTGLEILSAQTSAISRETSQLSTRLAVELDNLTSELAKVVESFRELRERNIEFKNRLVKEAVVDNTNLHDYRDRAIKVLQQIGEVLPELESQTRTATQQADFVKVATEPLVRLQMIISRLTAAARAAADRSGVEVEVDGLTDHFLGIYTMKSEADAHHRALNQAVSEPVPSESSAEVDFFGFDDLTGDVTTAVGTEGLDTDPVTHLPMDGSEETMERSDARTRATPPDYNIVLQPISSRADVKVTGVSDRTG